MFLLTLALWAVFFVLSEVLKPKPKQERLRPAHLGDFQFPTATEDRVVPLLWGTVKLAGPNVVWYGDLRQRAIKKKVKTGIFSSHEVTTGFKYKIGIQFGLCRGAVDELLRIWIGDDVVWTGSVSTSGGAGTIDKPKLFGGNELGQGGVVGTFRFYTGGDTDVDQPVSTYLAQFQQEGGDTPRYVGTSHLVWERGYVGNSAGNIKPWAFECRRIPNGLGLSAGQKALNGGNDCNPMNVIYELLTDTEWGFGLPEEDIDLPNFKTAAATLATEGNGFSFLLDQPLQASDFLTELERQIDGVIFTDRQTGKWKINLARAGDTSIGDVDENTTLEVKEFSRGAWQDTSNVVRVSFSQRDKDYFSTFAVAQDLANVRLQGGQLVTASQSFPGVKDPTLANSLAWRSLRTLAYPLAKLTVVVDRTFWAAQPGDVFLFSRTELGITDLQMRIVRVDLGELANGRITIVAVEDIFKALGGSFADPAVSGWVAPVDDLQPYTSDEVVVTNAPRGFITRDVDNPVGRRRVWVGARQTDDGVAQFTLNLDTDDDIIIDDLLMIGELVNDLNPAPVSTSTVLVSGTPDTVADMLDEFISTTAEDVGQNLVHIMKIENEYIACLSSQLNGSDLQLNTVYRGLLGTVPEFHASGALVQLLFVGGGISSFSIPGSTVDVRLVKESGSDVEATLSAYLSNNFPINDLYEEPYPPAGMTLNNSSYPTSRDLADVVSGITDDDGTGILAEWAVRRDFRTSDEVAAIVDESSLPSDFPTANTTEYRHVIVVDPTGSPINLATGSWISTQADFRNRSELYYLHNGTLTGETIRSKIETRHVFESSMITSSVDLYTDFTVTDSDIDGRTFLGRMPFATSRSFTAPDTGSYDFTIGEGIAAIQAQINGGGYSDVITLAGTTGTLVGVTAGDTIDVKSNTSGGSTNYTVLLIDPPTSAGYWGPVRQ